MDDASELYTVSLSATQKKRSAASGLAAMFLSARTIPTFRHPLRFISHHESLYG